MKKKYAFLIVIILSIVLMSIYGFSYAKYVSNTVWNYYLKSQGFYMSSDFVGNNVKNVNNIWDGSSVKFNLKNSDNDLLISEFDINYKVTCNLEGSASTSYKCNLYGTDSNIYNGILSSVQSCVNNTNNGVNVSAFTKTECDLGGYDWTSYVANKDLYFDLVNIGTTPLKDVIVNITIESISPYKKTLSGSFILHLVNPDEGDITLNYTNKIDYDRLVVSNSNLQNKCVKLKWADSDLKIDVLSSELVSSSSDVNGNINQIVFNIDSKTSKGFKFYNKNKSKTFDKTAFTFEELLSC